MFSSNQVAIHMIKRYRCYGRICMSTWFYVPWNQFSITGVTVGYVWTFNFMFTWKLSNQIMHLHAGLDNTMHVANPSLMKNAYSRRLKIFSLVFNLRSTSTLWETHDDIIKCKHFPRYWPFVWGIHRVNSPHKGLWRGALMFSLICICINS